MFKPMLASPADLDTLRYPLYASPKLDGIRAMVRGGRVVSRKLIEIPNRHVQALLAKPQFEGLDGELIVGVPTAEDVYRVTNSFVMAQAKVGEFTFYVFDHVGVTGALSYSGRMQVVQQQLRNAPSFIRWHHQTLINDRTELDGFEAAQIAAGFEGIITRDPASYYKHGRSTSKEQIMLKVKRFEDSEAEIIGIEEEMHNANEAGRDNLGRTKRSTAKDGKIGKGTMGALVVRDLKTGVEFNIGTGFNANDREASWPLGEIVTYKFFPVGVKDKPRHPVFKGRRSKIDL